MAELTELLNESTRRDNPNLVTPSIAGAVVGQGGKILWQHAAGASHHDDEAVTGDSVFWLASQSKLMCTIASLQTVEKGLIGLDDDVSPHLPDLEALEVLDGGVDVKGVPTTRPRQNKITLRLLLSHQSGVACELMPMSVAQWAKATGLQSALLDSDQVSIRKCPLAFEPGTSWSYGASIDWAGVLVAKLNKMSLEEFYAENIWKPLGMSKTTFHPTKFASSIVQGHVRSEDGRVTASPMPVPLDPITETAGHGAWGSPNDYVKVLGALLDGGGPLLSQQSVDEIFSVQTPDTEPLTSIIHGIYKPALGPSIPKDQKVHHGLAGVMNVADFPGRRKAYTLQWSGMPNMIWWIDRETGIAATAMMQLLPVGDPTAVEFNIKFEETVYKLFGKT